MARKGRTYVELEGVEALRRALVRLEFAALRNAKDQIKESAEAIEAGAKSRVRVDTGETREGIKTVFYAFGLTASVGSGAPNARSEEFGNANKTGRPFLFPSYEVERPRYLKGIEDAINHAGDEASE